MAPSSLTFSRAAALVLAAFAGIAQGSPRPQHYHAAAVQWDMHDTFLYSVNANGVAAGYQSSSVSQGVVWQDGVLRQLGCHNDVAPYSYAYSINDAMQVAGTCYRSSGDYAVVWDAAGNPTPIRDGAIEADTAAAINNLGHVVGTEGRVAYVWKGAKLKLLGTLGGSTSSPTAISDKGWIVGGSKIAGDVVTHAFVYRNGQMEDLGWGGDFSIANGVNDRGHIVGWRYTGSVFAGHAIFDDGVSVVDLGRHSAAQGINHLDQVVGSWNDHGFIYTHGRMYDLNSLLDSTTAAGWDIRVAYSINDAGVIVGWGVFGGSYQPVVLTPVP